MMILNLLCICLLSASVSSLFGIKKITPCMVKESGCFSNFVYFDQEAYTDKYLTFLETDPRVKGYDHTGLVTDVLKVKNYTDPGDDQLFDISFVPASGEKRMETFDADLGAFEHPIVLADAVISIIDAYVDAELSTFDISKDLTLKLEPAVIPTGISTQQRQQQNAYGLSCNLCF